MNENKPVVKRPMKRAPKKKVCQFCQEVNAQKYANRHIKEGEDKATVIDAVDYMDVAKLRRFITERGKIMPSRMTGTCAYHQRQIAAAVKRARVMALLPYTDD